MRTLPGLLREDADHILTNTSEIWGTFAGKTLLITGGTGFFGKWLLESWSQANRAYDLRAKAIVVTRSPHAFLASMPHLAAGDALEFIQGDVRDFEIANTQTVDYVLHAATPASVRFNSSDPMGMFNVIVDGTRHVLTQAARHGVQKVLLVSSGAAYGPQPFDLSHISESYGGAPDPLDPLSAYGEGKRQSEHLCALYAQTYGFSFCVARCFAFAGPYLPLDGTYAIGNFMRDARRGGPIVVQGDGSPYRSYLYAADLTVWLWQLLVRGSHATLYNVGSEHEVSIADLARSVARFYGCGYKICGLPNGRPPTRYVPACTRIFEQLQMQQHIQLHEALARTERHLSCGTVC